MSSAPPIESILPVFYNSFEAGLNHVAKIACVSSIALPLIGGILVAPLLIATRLGNDKDAEKSPLVGYVLTPIASIGVPFCITGLVAISIVALSVILDLTHQLALGRQAICYRYIFFPFKFNFLNDIMLNLNSYLPWRAS